MTSNSSQAANWNGNNKVPDSVFQHIFRREKWRKVWYFCTIARVTASLENSGMKLTRLPLPALNRPSLNVGKPVTYICTDSVDIFGSKVTIASHPAANEWSYLCAA
jgi:hypothetical protein